MNGGHVAQQAYLAHNLQPLIELNPSVHEDMGDWTGFESSVYVFDVDAAQDLFSASPCVYARLDGLLVR